MLIGILTVDRIACSARLLRAGVPPREVVRLTGAPQRYCRHIYRTFHDQPFSGSPAPSVRKIFELRNPAAGRFLLAYAERFSELHRHQPETCAHAAALVDLVEQTGSMHCAMFDPREMATLVARYLNRDIDVLRCRDCSSPLIALDEQAPMRCPKCGSQRGDYEEIAPPEVIARGIVVEPDPASSARQSLASSRTIGLIGKRLQRVSS